ncbi:MAG TPA: nuclease A inhibitor family protein [Kofleriaceae bacterium]|nr:nuclease A inhibitor family protein [Kofleriaceae bacterium]
MRNAVVFVAILSLSACMDAGDTDATEGALTGTPDELALTRFLNDATTTVQTLDTDVALDRRAAQNLIAHRDGADGVLGTADDDRFDTSDEVDAVAYVGPSAMTKLVAFANAGGWVKDGELFGNFDGVPFTVAQARATVTLATTATAETLHDTIKLDPRAVSSIVAARPIATMAQLASLYYVGPSALTKLRDYVPAPACTGTDDDVVAGLKAATDGMWLTSESDYPLEVVSWASSATAADSGASFLKLLGRASTTHIVPNTPDWFFERLGYSNDQSKVDALRAYVGAHLTNVHVYEVDLIQVHDYLVGVAPCGTLVAFTAISIET